MTVYETEVPGVGRKFEMEVGDGERVIVIIHHDGERELYYRVDDRDSEKLLSLSDRRARQLGSILDGAYFQPVATEDVQVPLGEAIIEWVDVEPASPVAGETIEEANVRSETGVSIIAVQRGEETVANPDPTFTVEAGDILVALGTGEEQRALSELVAPDD